MFHKEGQKIIFITLVFVVATSLLIDNLQIPWLAKLIQFSLLVILVLILQFFRNPKRHTHQNDCHVIAPVDGKVVVIEEVEETEATEVETEDTEEQESVEIESWRDLIEDEKLQKHAERFTSVDALVQANLESRQKLSKSIEFKEFTGLKILKKTYKNKLKIKSNFGKDKITLYKI